MKVVILAGGAPSTLNNEREGIPKPMIYIGGKPLLWHIMKHFSEYGLNEFIICGGYRVDMIKEYFCDFYIYESDITVDLAKNTVEVHRKKTEDWIVTVVDTGLYSSTGQRVEQVEKFVTEGPCIVTFGDCLSDIDVTKLLEAHYSGKKTVTVALAKPQGRNRLLPFDDGGEISFDNPVSPENDNAWIKADCFVFDRKAFGCLEGHCSIERELLAELSGKDELALYRHYGYWSAIETKRDLTEAERLWNTGEAPWIGRKAEQEGGYYESGNPCGRQGDKDRRGIRV